MSLVPLVVNPLLLATQLMPTSRLLTTVYVPDCLAGYSTLASAVESFRRGASDETTGKVGVVALGRILGIVENTLGRASLSVQVHLLSMVLAR